MPVLTPEEVLGKLNNIHKKGNAMVAQCPVCGDDHHLYINNKEGKLLFYCQKCGAGLKEIRQALVGEHPTGGTAPAAGQNSPKGHGRKTEQIVYVYRDPKGKEMYSKIRRKFEDGHKTFSFIYTDPDGTVHYNKPNSCNNLYNLDRLAAAKKTDRLYIVEGEKCADAMTKAGFLATSTNTGAKSPKLSGTDQEYISKFADKVIIPDNDEPGQVYAEAWAERGAKILPLPEIWPECPVKGDVADYLGAGGDPEKIRTYKFPVVEFSEDYFNTLSRNDLVEHEFLLKLINIEDQLQRQRAETLARFRAADLGMKREFEKNLKAVRVAATQAKNGGQNLTKFDGQPLALRCGDWIADDDGVRRMTGSSPDGRPTFAWASRIPLLPSCVLVNPETGMERIELSFYKTGKWNRITANRADVANKSRIVNLADQGLEVTSDNAQNMVRYISECVTNNPELLPRENYVDHFGYTEAGFVPYTDDVKIDIGPNGQALVSAVSQKGTLAEWLDVVRPLMAESIYLRLTIAASLASPLLTKINGLPYVFHLWGGTGSGKTVGLMVAASVWGNPRFGGLVRTMNMTDNAVQGVANTLRNLPFFGDELQTIKDAFNGYDRFLYRITEQTGRGRMNADRTVAKNEEWNCGFIFTGEEPITQESSGGGAKNRVIEAEVNDVVVKNGNQAVRAISKQYGTLGPEYIKKIEELDIPTLYDIQAKALLETGTTEKQAMTMALLMIADDIFRVYFLGSSLPGLMVKDVLPFMLSKKQVDVSERAYAAVIGWAAENTDKFYTEWEDPSPGLVWGERSESCIYINKTVLIRFLSENGFNFETVKKPWVKSGKMLPTEKGKFAWCKSVQGIKAYYICLKTS